MRFCDTPEFKRGQVGEDVVAKRLCEMGYSVFRASDSSGRYNAHAPQLQAFGARGVPVPDLDVSRHRRRFWVEVKTKSRAAVYRIWGCRAVHGIDSRCFQAYCAVERATGSPVWLAVYELDSKKVLIGRMTELSKDGCSRLGNDHGEEMVYIARDAFTELTRPDFDLPLNQTMPLF